MDLAPYLPPVTGGETTAAWSLLRVLSDPHAAEEVLKKLVAECAALDAKLEEFRQQSTKVALEIKEASDKLLEAHNELGEAEKLRAATLQTEKEIKAVLAMLNERESNVVANEAALASRRDETEARERMVTAWEKTNEAHEKALGNRSKDLDEREAKLMSRISAHQAWVAGLKPPTLEG